MALVLSVLIPTLARRQQKFLQLMEHLGPQTEAVEGQVEVIGLQNQGEELLENYRERLLHAARGKYLCFIDDDDEIAPYYIDDILDALQHQPDMVAWRHLNTGTPGGYTEVSLGNKGKPLGVIEGGYWREFTHMNPVRADLARHGSFLSGGPGFTGEDMAFVRSVLPFLRTQWHLPRPVYCYHWNAADSTQNGRQPPPVPHQRPELPYACFRWCE